MTKHQVQHLLLLSASLWTASFAAAEICDDGVCFIDRGANGEIVLGALRGGIGVIDFDADGFKDLIVGDSIGLQNRLFHNVIDEADPSRRTFEDVTAGSGLDDNEGRSREAGGVLVADYDNDGDQDVFFVSRNNNNTNYGLLYSNNGDGTFANVTAAAGLRQTGAGAESASWADFDLDGDVDLMITRVVSPWIQLFRNNGDSTFTDVSQLLPAIAGFTHSYTNAWMDYDQDGWPDCFLISNSGDGTDVLLHNISDGDGGRRFENSADAVGYVDQGPAPMGIAFGDYDNDGDFDLGISDADIGTYFENTGGSFKKIKPFATMFGWGVDWLDVDNDCDVDFYTAGSWRTSRPDNLQLNQGDGTFLDGSALLNGVSAPTQFSVQVDFNNDGRQDIVAVAPNTLVSIYENTSTIANNWFRVDLRGDGRWVNRDAAGAVIRLTAGGRSQVRLVSNGTSTTATEDLRAHFGVGAAETIDEIEVLWPRAGGLASRTEVFSSPFDINQTMTLMPLITSGDLNCDGDVNFADIDGFVTALTSPADYESLHPDCYIGFGDLDGDGDVNFADIDPFVDQLLR